MQATGTLVASGAAGTPQQFTVHYTDPLGASDIAFGQALFTTNASGPDGGNACQIEWNTSRMMNLVSLGSYVNGTIGQVIGNGSCTINGSTMTQTSNGYDLALTITFGAEFSGVPIYVYAYGENAKGLSSPWWSAGSWVQGNPLYTISTAPVTGMSITVDGQNYTSPQGFQWTPGTNHTIATTTTQPGTAGTQYVFSAWSDAGTVTHTVTAPSASFTYTANFSTQYPRINSCRNINRSGAPLVRRNETRPDSLACKAKPWSLMPTS